MELCVWCVGLQSVFSSRQETLAGSSVDHLIGALCGVKASPMFHDTFGVLACEIVLHM